MSYHRFLLRKALPPHSQRRTSTQIYTRVFSSSLSNMVSQSELSISDGEDTTSITEQTTLLIDDGKWTLCNSGKGLERPFKFKTFKATWDFMNQIAAECKTQKHHPEWSNIYNKTHIRWTTHSPEGLSSKDIRMAKFCDEAAKQFNEVEIDPSEGRLGADGKIEAGDCCTPKKQSL